MINDYFRGVSSVLGLSRTGVYGGYWPLTRLKTARLAAWFWQTIAWSGGKKLPGRHIYQYAQTVKINGVSCDVDTATATDYGQWQPGKTPTPSTEDDMPLTKDDIKAIWDYQLTSPTSGQLHPAGTFVRYGDQHYQVLAAKADQLGARLDAQSAAITALAQQLGTGADVDRIVSSVQAAIADAVVHVTVDTGDDTEEKS
jgi:hypothetical protein